MFKHSTKEINSLNEEQVKSFNDYGFLIVDANIPLEIIDSARTDLLTKYPNNNTNKFRPGTRLQDAWKHSDAVHQLAINKNVSAFLEQLYGKKAKAFQTLNFPVGTQQKLHSDTIHFNSVPSGYMAGVWVALEDITSANGPLIYYPGSHKLPEYNMQDIGLGIGYENYKRYEQFIEQKMKTLAIDPVFGLMKKGQALIWHANLIHGGSKRRDELTTRHSQVTHYYFEGCQYYTPMMSTKDDIAWRNPAWIPLKKSNFYGNSRQILSRARRLFTSKK